MALAVLDDDGGFTTISKSVQYQSYGPDRLVSGWRWMQPEHDGCQRVTCAPPACLPNSGFQGDPYSTERCRSQRRSDQFLAAEGLRLPHAR